jgi:hypothetical protein
MKATTSTAASGRLAGPAAAAAAAAASTVGMQRGARSPWRAAPTMPFSGERRTKARERMGEFDFAGAPVAKGE